MGPCVCPVPDPGDRSLVLSGLLLACSPAAQQPEPRRARPQAAPAGPSAAARRRRPAATDPRPCWPAMSTRDKLAQLLMVGVRGAADARAVVDNHHVGGIFDRQLDRPVDAHRRLARRHRRGRGPAAAGGERRRGGRPGVAVVGADRQPAVAAGAGRRPDARRGVRDRARSAARRCGIWASPSTSPPSSTSPTAPDDTVIGDRSFGADPDRGHRIRRCVRPRAARCRRAAGAQALPRARPRLG